MKRNYFLFLVIASTDPITATAMTAPIMPYRTMLDIPDAGEDFLTGVNEIVFDIPAPLTVIEPDDNKTEILRRCL